MMQTRKVVFFFSAVWAAVGFGQSDASFFRILSPTGSLVRAFSPDGTAVWTNDAVVGVTCRVQRATSLTGPSNWVDFVRHEATNATVALRLFDLYAPEGMALIPAGLFRMGGAFPEDKDNPIALPVHEVFVSAFYVAKSEVTWAKWCEVRDWSTNGHGYAYDGAGGAKGEGHPVHSVTWYDAVKWCNALSEMQGRSPCYTWNGVTYKAGQHDDITCAWAVAGYRLPTEAEWEKAARGGPDGLRFPWGDTVQHGQGNYRSTTTYLYDVSATRGFHPLYAVSEYPYTSPVCSFPQNGFGLFDTSGNVAEWCWDWYGGTSYYGTSPVSDPRGPGSGLIRMMRGGSWWSSAIDIQSPRRGWSAPSYCDNRIGFRVALSVAAP